MDCDDSDSLRLAMIQGSYHPVDSPGVVSASSPTNSGLSQSSYASVIGRHWDEHLTVHNRGTNVDVRNRTTPDMSGMVVLKLRHLGNVSDGTVRRSEFRKHIAFDFFFPAKISKDELFNHFIIHVYVYCIMHCLCVVVYMYIYIYIYICVCMYIYNMCVSHSL